MTEINTYQRQWGLVKPEELDFPILVVGAGGLGSWITLALAKMGCSDITVIDFDTVELHNVPSQLYTKEQIGMWKVGALKENVKSLTDTEICPIVGKVELGKKIVYDVSPFEIPEFAPEVVIVAVDSLVERKNIWEALKELKVFCYIDVRMGGELFRALSVCPVDPLSVASYEKILSNKTKPHIEECTARAIVYNTLVCAGVTASIVKKYAKKEPVKKDFIFDIASLEVS